MLHQGRLASAASAVLKHLGETVKVRTVWPWCASAVRQNSSFSAPGARNWSKKFRSRLKPPSWRRSTTSQTSVATSPMRFWTSWKISKYSARAMQSEDAMTNMSWGVKLLLPYCNGIAESNTLSFWIWWVVPIGVIYNCGKHPTIFAPTSSWKKRITCVSNLAQPKMLSNEWMHWGENAKWGKDKGVSTTKLAWAHWTHWHWLSHAGSCSPPRDIRLTCSSKPSTACPPLPSSSCFKASTLSYTMLHSYRLLLYVQGLLHTGLDSK